MIKVIKELVGKGEYRFTLHGFERCIERDIEANDIKDAIMSGESIEDYPEDKYGPSMLICGKTKKGRIIHVQCSVDPVWIITAYDPSRRSDEWESDFKRRI
jgi:hypothetical protein